MLNKKMISITTAAILAMTPAIAVRAEGVSQNEKSTETEDTTESASEERAADTEPVSGIAHAKSYEELYDVLQKWQENLSSGNTNARVMMIEESAMDAAASSDTASSDSMAASNPMIRSTRHSTMMRPQQKEIFPPQIHRKRMLTKLILSGRTVLIFMQWEAEAMYGLLMQNP